LAIHYLKTISDEPETGYFIPLYIKTGEQTYPMIHSKLMIVDEEFVLVGNANVSKRSMCHDTEVHLGIVDSVNEYARDLRIRLWQEHMASETDDIWYPLDGIQVLYNFASTQGNRLCLYSTDHPGDPPILHETTINNYFDPGSMK